MVSVLNTDTMIVTRKELSFKIINILDLFFRDPRSYDFTLFFWPKKTASGLVRVDIEFNWKIVESKQFITSSSAFSLFESQNFKEPFMLLETNKEVSHFIKQSVSSFEVAPQEFNPNFSLVNGVTIHRDTWSKMMNDLLGAEHVVEFYAEQRFNKLEGLLSPKDFKDKLVKI